MHVVLLRHTETPRGGVVKHKVYQADVERAGACRSGLEIFQRYARGGVLEMDFTRAALGRSRNKGLIGWLQDKRLLPPFDPAPFERKRVVPEVWLQSGYLEMREWDRKRFLLTTLLGKSHLKRCSGTVIVKDGQVAVEDANDLSMTLDVTDAEIRGGSGYLYVHRGDVGVTGGEWTCNRASRANFTASNSKLQFNRCGRDWHVGAKSSEVRVLSSGCGQAKFDGCKVVTTFASFCNLRATQCNLDVHLDSANSHVEIRECDGELKWNSLTLKVNRHRSYIGYVNDLFRNA